MKFDAKQKKYIIRLIEFIFIIELLFKIDNKVIQSIGIALLPVLLIYTYLLLKSN